MAIWSAEIKELEKLYESFKGQLPELEKELEQLIRTEDANVIMLYSRRCLEVILTDLCECELNRERGTEPLKGIIDKLNKEKKIPAYIISSIHGLNELSTYGTHPKDFDPEQIKPVLVNLDVIIKWYLKYKDTQTDTKIEEDVKDEIKVTDDYTEQNQNPRKSLILLLSGITLVVVIVVLALFVFDIIGGKKRIKEHEKSIALLPFKNDSPDQERMYFINGIMEAILDNLCKIEDLRVPGRTSVERYRDYPKSIPTIAKELDVNYILEGSGHRDGNNVRLYVQLLDGRKDKHLWSKTYDLNIEEIFSMESEIAQLVAAEIEAIITPDEKQLIEKIPTRNLTALDFYQRGREELGKFPFHDLLISSTTYPIFFDYPTSESSLHIARQMFKTALRYDSTFAPVYAELAAIFWSENYFKEPFSINYLDSVLFLANKALSFDDRLPDAYYIRGKYYSEIGNIKQARKDFDKTVQLDPNHWMAYYGKGELYLEEFTDADYRVAIENFRKAASLYHGSALPILLVRTAYALRLSGFDELAKGYNLKASNLELDSAEYYLLLYESGGSGESIEKAYNKDSTNILILWRLGGYYDGLGKFKESLKIYRKYLNRLKENGIMKVNDKHRIGIVYVELGIKDSADYIFKEQIENCNTAIRLGRPYGISFAYWDLAMIYEYMGDKTKALENLDIFKQREGMCSWFASGLKGDFRKFRNDSEFQEVFKEIETKYNAEHERVKKWLEEQGML